MNNYESLMKKTKKQKSVDRIKSDLDGNTLGVMTELKIFKSMDEADYLSQSSNETGEKILGARGYFIVYKNVQYPMKAIAKMACWRQSGDFLQTQSNYYAQALEELGVKILHQPKTQTTNTPTKKFYEVLSRPEQSKFRSKVLNLYGSQCVVTGCSVTEALEAAHVIAHSLSNDNSAQNGLPLRRDVHRLFDLGLISIHSDSLEVVLDVAIQNEYKIQCGSELVFLKLPSLKNLELLKKNLKDRFKFQSD